MSVSGVVFPWDRQALQKAIRAPCDVLSWQGAPAAPATGCPCCWERVACLPWSVLLRVSQSAGGSRGDGPRHVLGTEWLEAGSRLLGRTGDTGSSGSTWVVILNRTTALALAARARVDDPQLSWNTGRNTEAN